MCLVFEGGVSVVRRKGRSAHRIGLKREGLARLGKAGQTTDKTGLLDFLAPSSHLHTLTHPFFSLYSEQQTGWSELTLFNITTHGLACEGYYEKNKFRSSFWVSYWMYGGQSKFQDIKGCQNHPKKDLAFSFEAALPASSKYPCLEIH